MPVEFQDLLDYEGKIDRGSENISKLTAEGEKAAAFFLRQRAAAVAASPLGESQTAGQAESRGDVPDELPLSRWKDPSLTLGMTQVGGVCARKSAGSAIRSGDLDVLAPLGAFVAVLLGALFQGERA